MTTTAAGPGIQDRLEEVIDLISQLASGDLAARAVPSGNDDDVDAVLVGINMLAEDLQASREQLEARVTERTAELSAVNRDINMLVDLGRRLQSATSRADVLLALDSTLPSLFEPLSGAVHLFGETGDPATVSWGRTTLPGGDQNVAEDAAHIAVSAGRRVLGLLVLQGDSVGTRLLTPDKRRLGEATADQLAMTLINLGLRDMLRKQALRDPLTGLYNRRFVEEWLDREVSRAEPDSALGVVMIDLDHFKQVNDNHGHDAGDAVLLSVATTISAAVRTGDVACRYGGEEFLVLMPGITRAALAERVEDLRSRIAQTRMKHDGNMLPPVTVSVGAALCTQQGRTTAHLLRAADDALYAAKNGGRDQVRLSD